MIILLYASLTQNFLCQNASKFIKSVFIVMIYLIAIYDMQERNFISHENLYLHEKLSKPILKMKFIKFIALFYKECEVDYSIFSVHLTMEDEILSLHLMLEF